MVVGIANIIPGVSGGTMMVAMGLYDSLIHAITHLKREFKKSMQLLIPIFAGAGIAIIVWSDRRQPSVYLQKSERPYGDEREDHSISYFLCDSHCNGFDGRDRRSCSGCFL